MRGAYLVDELLGEDGGGGGESAASDARASLAVYLVCEAFISGSVAAEVLALQNEKQDDWQNEKSCEAKNEQRDCLYHEPIVQYVI